MARPLRIEYPGAFYHVTARGNEKKDIFKSQRDREKFLSYLEAAALRYDVVIHAYCLMNNHYHLMVETPLGNLSRIMKHINSSYTTYYNVKRKRTGHLLQGRYKAILIDADEYAAELSRYIHLNPVRVGAVDNPEDYLWSSCRYYTSVTTSPAWLRTGFILGYFGKKEDSARKKYRQFVHDLIGREYSSPLLATVASTILGSADFITEIQDRHLGNRKGDREQPALRELSNKPSPEVIVGLVRKACPTDDPLATKVAIYLCHRFSGAKLKELGAIFQVTESAITQASKRFAEKMEHDKQLKGMVQMLGKSLNLSIV